MAASNDKSIGSVTSLEDGNIYLEVLILPRDIFIYFVVKNFFETHFETWSS